MSHIEENLSLDNTDNNDVGLGDAEDNLLWKPQNIQVTKYTFIDIDNSSLLRVLSDYLLCMPS